MVTVADLIISMSIALINGGVDLDCEDDIVAALRADGFSPDEVAAMWEHAREEAMEARLLSAAVSGMEAA